MRAKSKNNLIAMPWSPAAGMSDAELVQAVAEENRAALRTVWDRYLPAVHKTLYALLGNDQAIDDLVQEVFLTFYNSAGRIRDRGALRPYLLGVAAKLAVFEIRTRSRRSYWHRLFHGSSASGLGAVGPDVEGRDALRSLRAVLEKIPERERQAFVLRHVHDLSPAEVAEAMALPQGTAKRAISEGRRRVFLRAQKEPALAEYLRTGEEGLP